MPHGGSGRVSAASAPRSTGCAGRVRSGLAPMPPGDSRAAHSGAVCVRRPAAPGRRRRDHGPTAWSDQCGTAAGHDRAPRRSNHGRTPRGRRRGTRSAAGVRRRVAPMAVRPARGEGHMRWAPANAGSRRDGTGRGLVCVLPERGRDRRGDPGGRAAIRREDGAAVSVLGRVAPRGVGARGQGRAVARRRAGRSELGHPPLAPSMDAGALAAARNPARDRAGRCLAVAPGRRVVAQFLMQRWVNEQAERRPDATAVVMEGVRLSYGELDAASNRLARTLRAAGCDRGDRVCLLLPKSPTAIVSLLGVLKADAIYVPVDVSSPAPRVAKIVGSAEPRVILAAGRAAALLDDLLRDPGLRNSVRVGWMEHDAPAGLPCEPAFSLAEVESAPPGAIDWRNAPSDPAHILFTSGSTGMPKGEVITHANVTCVIEWAVRHFGLGPVGRALGRAPLHFDLSTFDVFGSLAAGAALHLVPHQLNLLPHKLAEFIRTEELTQWFSVPSVLHLMAKLDV